MAARFEVYKDGSEKYRWRLKSSNGRTTATGGEAFSSKSAAKAAAEAVKKAAAGADVVDA